MKPHPKLRKTMKWGGAAVSVLLVVVWIGSGWIWLGWDNAKRTYTVGCGAFFVVGRNVPSRAGFFFTFSPPTNRFDWWYSSIGTKSVWQDGYPLWPVVIPPVIVTVAIWHLDVIARRRARVGLCPKCNYDRAGIAGDAKCPECGAMSVVAGR